MTQIKIENAGGTLECDAISWSEGQSCDPAMRQVPLIDEGEFVDTGTFVIDNRKLTVAIRLTDAQKTILNNIFDANAIITITAITETNGEKVWLYTCWLSTILKEYKYSKEGSDEREWEVKLEFYCSSFSYGHYVEFDEPLDWGYFKNRGEIWLGEVESEHGGGYIDWFGVSLADPFAEQGGGYMS